MLFCLWDYVMWQVFVALVSHTLSSDLSDILGVFWKRLLYGLEVCIGKLFSLFLIQNVCCVYSKEMSQ